MIGAREGMRHLSQKVAPGTSGWSHSHRHHAGGGAHFPASRRTTRRLPLLVLLLLVSLSVVYMMARFSAAPETAKVAPGSRRSGVSTHPNKDDELLGWNDNMREEDPLPLPTGHKPPTSWEAMLRQRHAASAAPGTRQDGTAQPPFAGSGTADGAPGDAEGGTHSIDGLTQDRPRPIVSIVSFTPDDDDNDDDDDDDDDDESVNSDSITWVSSVAGHSSLTHPDGSEPNTSQPLALDSSATAPTITAPSPTAQVITTTTAAMTANPTSTTPAAMTANPTTTATAFTTTTTTTTNTATPPSTAPVKLSEMGDTAASETLRVRTTWYNPLSPTMLRDRYKDHMDIIYSYVNGSEPNHYFRKLQQNLCMPQILQQEAEWYASNVSINQPNHLVHSCFNKSVIMKQESHEALLKMLIETASKHVNERDRETDELRYSLRSIEQHMTWHTGRIAIVSPGHAPQWMDHAKNFFGSACDLDAAAEATGRLPRRHRRIEVVHQDALLPYGMRLTVDSHVIEQHLYRVRNLTALHVYFNDDYFVNRDVAVSDLLNPHGGSRIRTESGWVPHAVHGDDTSTWSKGVFHTNLFNLYHLDNTSESYLTNAALTHLIAKRVNHTEEGAASSAVHSINNPSLNGMVHTARHYAPDPLPPMLPITRKRYFATHAPFVYCTRMFEFLNTRFEREFAHNALLHRTRKSRDLFMPFVYHAFAMARPWAASPKYLRRLIEISNVGVPDGRRASHLPSLPVDLDNFDGCAPATSKMGFPSNQVFYTRFEDNMTRNTQQIAELAHKRPIFFNVNTGFTWANCSQQLVDFLQGKFPMPTYLEAGASVAALTDAFEQLMALPLLLVATHEENECALVRSVQLGLPRFRGPVVLVRAAPAAADHADLGAVRERRRHRVRSAMPVVRCALAADRVRRVELSDAGDVHTDVAALVQRVLGTGGGSGAVGGGPAAVLPSGCSSNGGAAAAADRVRALVVDARLAVLTSAAVKDADYAVEDVLAIPGQQLALRDFRRVALRDRGGDDDVALVVSRADAEPMATHWITASSELEMLVSFPLPCKDLENWSVPLQWAYA